MNEETLINILRPSFAFGMFSTRMIGILLTIHQQNGVSDFGAMANHLRISKPATSRLLDSLYEHGFTRRLHRKDDKRRVNIALTEQGTAFVKQMLGASA